MAGGDGLRRADRSPEVNTRTTKIFKSERYNYLIRALVRRNYIANNLPNSHVKIYFCALRNTPVDLFKVPF